MFFCQFGCTVTPEAEEVTGQLSGGTPLILTHSLAVQAVALLSLAQKQIHTPIYLKPDKKKFYTRGGLSQN